MANETAVVDVKPSWASKINWMQLISVLASLLVVFGINIPPELQAQVAAAITAISGIVTIVMRTYFTTSLTAASASKL